MGKKPESSVSVLVPSEELLYWAFLGWLNDNLNNLDELNCDEKMSSLAQIAASMTFGTDALVHTDGINYFSVYVPVQKQPSRIFFGDAGHITSSMYGSVINTSSTTNFATQKPLLKKVAEGFSELLSNMVEVQARPVALASSKTHTTVQELFLESDPADIMAVAAILLYEDSSCYEYNQDVRNTLWGVYRGVCQTWTSSPKGYVTLLDNAMGIVPGTELQNPLFDDPVNWSWEISYDIHAIAAMPISNLTFKYVDDDIIAGRLLAEIITYCFDNSPLPMYYQPPTSVYLRTCAALDDDCDEGTIRSRLVQLAGAKGQLEALLPVEKEEFLG